MIEIDALRNYLKAQPVLKAYLFGSSVRGNQDDNSDIDLLVELAPEMNLFAFAKMKIQLEELLQKQVDLVSANGLSAHIKPFIDSEKVLIYER